VNPLHPEVNMLNLSQMERIMKQADLMKEVAEQEAQILKMVSP